MIDNTSAPNVTPFPFEKTVERLPNDPSLEFVFEWTRGMPPAAAKRMIMQMRAPELAWLDQTQAEIALDALNLRSA